ncbi:GNAT family acetyltransferase [Denitrobaculum tricleocarpae]|uniref:GNAT family acetyltransferase n=1 Tax=Denitrobaculum tricleocarpae TaxID=2591009 RepID=A0A545TUD3_9PROT|nr:GNAT family acetyltransferase [Denitrobaculum tricleocarpae]TQV80771.1 GNAT family acetyltransferase [Denitrobaculum tricleocarpae]
MKIIGFRAEHLENLTLQPAQSDMARYMSQSYGTALAQSGNAFTAIKGGRVLGCAGVELIWANRGIAWSLLGKMTGPEMLGIHRRVSEFLNKQSLRRIEMTVDAAHTAGHRWARMLGFQLEGRLQAYTPEGRDCDLYARIKR